MSVGQVCSGVGTGVGVGVGGVQVKCAPSVTEAEPLLTENSLSHHGYPSNSTAPSLGSWTYYTLYTRINNNEETDPLRINLFAVFCFGEGYPAEYRVHIYNPCRLL